MLIARPFPSIHESYVLTLLENEFSVRIPNLPSVRRALNPRSFAVSFALSSWNDGSKEGTQKGAKEEISENVAGTKEKVIGSASHSPSEVGEALPEKHHLVLPIHESSQSDQVLGSPLHIPSRRQSHAASFNDTDTSSFHFTPLHNFCGQSRDTSARCEVCLVSDGIDGPFIVSKDYLIYSRTSHCCLSFTPSADSLISCGLIFYCLVLSLSLLPLRPLFHTRSFSSLHSLLLSSSSWI